MDLELQNKVVIITGAASGIGLACTRAFVAEGARVGYLEQEPLVDSSKTVIEVVKEGVQEVVDILAEYDEINMKFGEEMSDDDVTNATQVQSMVDRARTELGSIDIMFSNAGGATPTPVEQQSLQDYRQLMALNFDAVFYCVHEALPLMLEQGRGCFQLRFGCLKNL